MDYPIAQATFRSPGGRPLTFSYRENTNDWNTLVASVTEDEYRLPRGLSGRAVDVGGYLGSVGIALAADNPGLQVTIIEPVPPNAALIRKNIEHNDLGDRVTLIEGAISGDHNPVTVWYGYRGNEAAEHHAFVGNSTLAYANGGELEHDEVTYTPITLADLTVKGDLDYLKIDCEGGEWSFLEGPVERVQTIVGEWHPVHGHTVGDLAALLGKTHVVTFSGPQAGPGGFRAVRR